MTSPRTLGTGRQLTRLFLYYAVLFGVVWALHTFLPDVYDLLIRTTVGGEEAALSELFTGDARVNLEPPSQRTIGTVLAITGSLLLMLPVAWVYMMTKRLEGYDRSVVQTLIMLPIAIAGVVVIVQNSTALAFSLAGIVAAVRFRNTLKDTKDAVYIFVAIAVGLSAGVRALDVSAAVSVLFNVVIIGLWMTNFGNVYADQRRGGGSTTPARGLTGAGGDAGQTLGDPDLLAALAPRELDELAGRAQRLREHVRAGEGKDKKERPNAVVLVHAADTSAAQGVAEDVFEECAKLWELVEISPAKEGVTTLEYLIRKRKSVTPAELLERLKEQGGPDIVATEFRSLKGLKS